MPAPKLFRQARFETSVAALETLPPEGRGEIAFAGRSNAGKSSALNTLVDHKRLAFVSKTPGRTQLINYFTLGNGLHLVDLPGYGYAKVPDAVRAPWGKLLGDYLLVRQSLAGLAVIMDARHPMTEHDRRLLAWFGQTGKPVHVLLTKADKLTRSDGARTLAGVQQELAKLAPQYSAQLFSSLKKIGIEAAERVFGAWLGLEVVSPDATKPVAPTPASRAGSGARDKSGPRNKKPRAKGDGSPGVKRLRY